MFSSVHRERHTHRELELKKLRYKDYSLGSIQFRERENSNSKTLPYKYRSSGSVQFTERDTHRELELKNFEDTRTVV